jgi:fatty-acid desaturase
VFGFTLFLITGIPPVSFVVTHTYHHANSDKVVDTKTPDYQSPHYEMKIGPIKIKGPIVSFLRFFYLYNPFVDPLTKRFYQRELRGRDWVTRIIYHKLYFVGPVILFCIYQYLFGTFSAVWMSFIQLMYLPVMAGYIVNGLNHMKEEPNEEKPNDHATNFFTGPGEEMKHKVLAFLSGGEAVNHGNHHVDMKSPVLGLFDPGFTVIKWINKLGGIKNVHYIDPKTEKKCVLS